MIVRRIHVRRFRGLAGRTLECGPGLNVIHGPNDAGKSTLLTALLAALFPVKRSEAGSFAPWGDEEPGEVTIEFDADGRVWTLSKDFAGRRTVLESGAGRWEDPKDVERQMADLLGFDSPSLFRATVYVRQWELAKVREDHKEIGAKLSAVFTGGGADAVGVLRRLGERIQQMEVGLHAQAKRPGPLKGDLDRIAALTAERDRLTAEAAEIEQMAATRDRTASCIADLERQAGEDEALLQANARLRDLDRAASEQERRAREAQAWLDRVDAAARDADGVGRDPALEIAAIAPETLESLRTDAARVEVLRTDVETAARSEGPAEPVPAPRPDDGGAGAEPQGRAAKAWSGVFAAAAAAVLGGAAALLARHSAWGVVLLAAAALAGAVAAALRRRGDAAALDARVRTEAEARRREAEAARIGARRRELREAEETLRARLQAVGVPSVEEAVARQARLLEAARRRDAARDRVAALLGGRTREALADEARSAIVALGATEAQRDDPSLAPRRLDAAAFQRVLAASARRKQELDDRRAELHRLDGKLAGRYPHEALARVEEDLAETQARYARERRLATALRLAAEVLRDAHRATLAAGKASLEDGAGRYLRDLSKGAYSRVALDGETLAPRVWVGPPKEWADVSAGEIGSGGADQCYLALRMALADVLDRRRCAPLFMDDPLLAYDDGRAAAAMECLRRAARPRQVFLLTCRGGVYDAYADHVTVFEAAAAPLPAAPPSPV